MLKMQRVHFLWGILWSTFSLTQVIAVSYVTLTHDGPAVLGGTVNFRADLYEQDGERPSGTFEYQWKDNAVTPNTYTSPTTSNTTSFWSVTYPRENNTIGKYRVDVVVKQHYLWWNTIAAAHTTFFITKFLNGNISISQSNKTLEDTYVSSAAETNITIDMRKSDYDYLAAKATAITTYWFIDCKYFGETSDISFQYNFTSPNVSHDIDALVIASYDPPTTVAPPTTTTTLPPSTTVPTNETISNATDATVKPSSPAVPVTAAPSTNTVPPTTPVSNTIDPTLNTTGTGAGAGKALLPFICSNSSIIPIDPNKTYGHFTKRIDIRAPISNISVEGTNWIKPWEMLSLNVTCKGSGPFYKCLKFHRGKYNVTGNETCDDGDYLHSCNFSIIHYFLEPSVYSVLVILNNNVSTEIYPLTINIYKVTKKSQLSVIVVPVSCTLAAVVPIVFGVAYYIQNRAKFTVEVADFDFGQNNPDMEYKTFRERLRDSFNNAINPGNKRISVRPPYYGSMNR